jgi:2-polyprenyl-3-methyl-5-hydroxy-6-metoxy-1,4-benzoquinol methylase
MPITRDFLYKNGIHVFDSDLDSSMSTYDERLITEQEKKECIHFWFSMRKNKICNFFENNIDKKMKILEVGGGTGYIAAQLQSKGYLIELSDIHMNGLEFAKYRGINQIYQFNLYSPPFENEFDLICLFDVLEHQKDDMLAMECLKKMLKQNGKILITVPSHQWLWNRDDKINGHYRRYSKKDLLKICDDSNLTPLKIEYFFSTITPLLLLRKFLNPDHEGDVAENEKLKFDIPKILNYFCKKLTELEFAINKKFTFCFGGSLLLLAEKKSVDV